MNSNSSVTPITEKKIKNPSSENSKLDTQSDPEKKTIYKQFIEGLAIFWVNLLLITFFATVVYFYRGEENWNGLDEETSDWFDCFYFSFTTMTTIGYGDISPASSLGKGICIVQQIIVLFQIANVISKMAIEKPIRVKFRPFLRRRQSDPELDNSTAMQRIGRRRVQSCQLDYHTSERLSRKSFLVPVRINHGESVEIELPLPPDNFVNN
tara:strand:+ start:119 stop:748 length:630 start_codon:yes stop_codon:yes gene_type:complete